MSTRAELRTALRTRLEDATASPLWDDAALDDAVAGAVRVYGARFPRQAVAMVPVAAGETRVPVTVAIDPARIVRVLDDAGAIVPRGRAAPEESAGAALGVQSWRWWDATLILARPVSAGTWQIEYLAPRATPPDDLTPVDILPGDDEIVLALALETALRRRATEDAKRGLRASGLAMQIEAARAEAARLIASRQRRARGGWL